MEKRPANIDRAAVSFEFMRSSGPGGQNVNKVSTAVRLRFDLRGARFLPAAVKERLARLAGRRLTEGGEIVIEARRFRTQEGNREDALERLGDLVRRAWKAPKKRRATAPTAGSRERRLASKRRRGLSKRSRGAVDDSGE